jgi:hypothetical protein
MLTNHELPECLLGYSAEISNYDFCLPHLLDQSEKYKKYFYKVKKEGRYIIMDNSLHELKDVNSGNGYDHERLMFWVNELQPEEFIVPDVWMDAQSTIKNAEEWFKYSYPANTTLVAVVQSKNFKEAEMCYTALKNIGYSKIAFSYGADWYADKFPEYDIDKAKMMGRISTIKQMFYNGVIKSNDRIHLLGCSLPQEFGWYENCSYIESIDTSNPIMAALEGIKYDEHGINVKPKANMNNFFNVSLDNIDINLVIHNVNTFRKINEL